MTTLAHRDTGSLLTDLTTRMGTGTTILAEPQLRDARARRLAAPGHADRRRPGRVTATSV